MQGRATRVLLEATRCAAALCRRVLLTNFLLRLASHARCTESRTVLDEFTRSEVHWAVSCLRLGIRRWSAGARLATRTTALVGAACASLRLRTRCLLQRGWVHWRLRHMCAKSHRHWAARVSRRAFSVLLGYVWKHATSSLGEASAAYGTSRRLRKAIDTWRSEGWLFGA